MRRCCRHRSQWGCGGFPHPVEVIQEAGPTWCRSQHRFTPCIAEGLVFFLFPPRLSPCLGGWGGLGKPMCSFASLQCAPVHSYIPFHLPWEGRLGVISTVWTPQPGEGDNRVTWTLHSTDAGQGQAHPILLVPKSSCALPS